MRYCLFNNIYCLLNLHTAQKGRSIYFQSTGYFQRSILRLKFKWVQFPLCLGFLMSINTQQRLTYLLTYLLTYSMVQSPSWEANWFAASQQIPRISRNPKVHYRTHKRPPPVSILGQPNPVHTPTSHLLEIRPNIIHPFTSRSPQWSLSLRFPHQDPLLTHTRHMHSPSHSSRFNHPHDIGWGVQII